MLSFVAVPLILGITFPAIASGWGMEIPVPELALRLLSACWWSMVLPLYRNGDLARGGGGSLILSQCR